MNSNPLTYSLEAATLSSALHPVRTSQRHQSAKVIQLPGAAPQPVQQLRRVGRLPRIVTHIRVARGKRDQAAAVYANKVKVLQAMLESVQHSEHVARHGRAHIARIALELGVHFPTGV